MTNTLTSTEESKKIRDIQELHFRNVANIANASRTYPEPTILSGRTPEDEERLKNKAAENRNKGEKMLLWMIQYNVQSSGFALLDTDLADVPLLTESSLKNRSGQIKEKYNHKFDFPNRVFS